MEFDDLLRLVGDEPVFETSLLLSGEVSPDDVRRQLSRWTRAGRILQLRRGVYTLAPPYQKIKPAHFVIANRMVRGSYVSCQSALAFYNLIPEYTPVVVSVAASRPARWQTPFGTFEFRHIKVDWLAGYRNLDLGGGQTAFVATPEKALLDLIYLQPSGDEPQSLEALRLQNLERLDRNALQAWAERSGKPKLRRAAAYIASLATAEMQEYETL
ncbi:MAG: hypothetical protein NNA18_05470 [Nitrospira sp.]|nr:hypothetical protein [Nitrospira sp.]